MAIYKSAVLLVWFCTTACSSQPEQVSFALRLEEGREKSLPKIVASAAEQLEMRTDSQTSEFGGQAGTLRGYLLSGGGVQVVIQNASVEECDVREGPRDPEFSKTLHNVKVFKTSPLAGSDTMDEVVATIRDTARRQGATILAESDKCRTPTPG